MGGKHSWSPVASRVRGGLGSARSMGRWRECCKRAARGASEAGGTLARAMRDVVATSELHAEEPGRPRRSLIVAVGPPRRDGAAWSCRVKITAGRVDRTLRAADSLGALAAALAAVHEELDALRRRGWRLYAGPEDARELPPGALPGAPGA